MLGEREARQGNHFPHPTQNFIGTTLDSGGALHQRLFKLFLGCPQYSMLDDITTLSFDDGGYGTVRF